MYGIFIVNDNLVELEEEAANELVFSQNIYSTNEKQIEFAAKLNSFVKLFNEINHSLNGKLTEPTPFTFQYCRGKFEVIETGNNSYDIAIIPDVLKTFLREIK